MTIDLASTADEAAQRSRRLREMAEDTDQVCRVAGGLLIGGA